MLLRRTFLTALLGLPAVALAAPAAEASWLTDGARGAGRAVNRTGRAANRGVTRAGRAVGLGSRRTRRNVARGERRVARRVFGRPRRSRR
jgi:hypothetical protein